MTGKKRTTFAKLARESKLRERRQEKQAKKDARKLAGGLEAEYLEQEPALGVAGLPSTAPDEDAPSSPSGEREL